MRRFHPFLILLVLILLAPLAAAQEPRDLSAIEQLHQRDAAAAKAGDMATLATLWTEDAVALPPGEPPVVGIDAIRAWLNKGQANAGKVETTGYQIEFHEVRVIGDQAIEWGRTSVAMRPKGAPGGMRASGNIMGVLRRQPDGTWKVWRAIWNLEKPSPERAADGH